jgi:hypothetical protein
VRNEPGGRKTQPLTTCREIHSHGSWSQIWTRKQENTATHILQRNLQPWQLVSDLDQEAGSTATHILQRNSQPWQLESDLDQEAGKHSHSQAAGEFTTMAAGVRFGPGGKKTVLLTCCRGIHSHGSCSQIWTRRQENTATHLLQGSSQPW